MLNTNDINNRIFDPTTNAIRVVFDGSYMIGPQGPIGNNGTQIPDFYGDHGKEDAEIYRKLEKKLK